ncbi:hypothetical protein F5Y10DRAFT_288473 [Nemania abortiva]|nr:hypothetical protein F5Y10DRAFT_288473 [Nemania abortiva]
MAGRSQKRQTRKQQRKKAYRSRPDITFTQDDSGPHGYLSLSYETPLDPNSLPNIGPGVVFRSAEHYLYWRKAHVFGNVEISNAIFKSETNEETRSLGRRIYEGVRGDGAKLWREEFEMTLQAVNYAKFTSKAAFSGIRRQLLSTAKHDLVYVANECDDALLELCKITADESDASTGPLVDLGQLIMSVRELVGIDKVWAGNELTRDCGGEVDGTKASGKAASSATKPQPDPADGRPAATEFPQADTSDDDNDDDLTLEELQSQIRVMKKMDRFMAKLQRKIRKEDYPSVHVKRPGRKQKKKVTKYQGLIGGLLPGDLSEKMDPYDGWDTYSEGSVKSSEEDYIVHWDEPGHPTGRCLKLKGASAAESNKCSS